MTVIYRIVMNSIVICSIVDHYSIVQHSKEDNSILLYQTIVE